MPTVLIVDDTRLMRLLLKQILSDDLFCVVGEAEDGATALEAYRQFRPDVVLLDMVMPGLDGIETARQLLAGDPGARVIMCTATVREEMMEQALAAGARGFIFKPFQPHTVRAAIQEVMAAQQNEAR